MAKKQNKKTARVGKKNQIFFYTVLFSFVFIVSASFAVAIFRDTFYQPRGAVLAEKVVQNCLVTKPVMTSTSAFPVLSAQAALAVDVDSQEVLFAKNVDTPLLPASTTKIITALVALDYYPQDMVLKVPDIAVDGQKMKLVAGEELTVNSLLYGLLVYSANDAAETLAANYPGGRPLFVAAMNLKAREMGLTKSSFTNPSGLDAQDHKTTAKDLLKATTVAMQNPVFAQIVSTKEITVASVDKTIDHKLVNINELLGEVDGVVGVKTGWTENARENLVTYIKRGDKKVMMVVLGSQDRFGETKELINWVFRNYSWRQDCS